LNCKERRTGEVNVGSLRGGGDHATDGGEAEERREAEAASMPGGEKGTADASMNPSPRALLRGMSDFCRIPEFLIQRFEI
jgi:hypothetical protein